MSINSSHISVQVGPYYEGEGAWNLSLKALVNKQAAIQQLEQLQKQTGGNLDTEWGFVLAFKTIDGKAQELQKYLNDKIQPMIEAEDILIKTHSDGTTLWLSFQLKPEQMEEIKEGFNMVFAQGLEEFAEKNENSIQLLLSSNTDFTFASELLKKGDRLMSVVMKSLKFVLKLDLAQDLVQAVTNVIENFEPGIANKPPFPLLLKFKNFKVDLEFKSSDDCPEFIRQNGFFGKSIQKWIQDGDVAVQDEFGIAILKQIQENMPNLETDFYFTIPNFLALSGNAKLPGVAQFLLEYGNIVDKL
ncbi:unnamed protein product (macronuclear) [Paramecium tetraurelia]|uniref:Uncharacterized protein n=1 Tax=Paramecium tetraurelia TaxID=5888 RepID=A0C3P4_PARTE|nr:uncharacterized protein GSPATT00034890001 [Paramecium tetraurelia]CAK65411.1 unnamed protein product [Paramecium tetraurelia]|eukprot:XP_001432808.1 hypothetical protein (macronuclear) [Paramecium tetraurelia strain d4-2]